MNTARLRYRFADYLAIVTAINLSGRIGLRERSSRRFGGDELRAERIQQASSK